ncbi:pantoate--beta-alanine ligase [Desulfotomaculum sp. 1211_IL3151]|uniref:pantoate--beta-alanine ligase n=1 Tax=Desulfotomaculum sp. 1211_IL3151 TaxID=3084055 RepID=UPI002FDA93F2
MRLCQNIEEVRFVLNTVRSQGKSIALVPTMGYLHQGHLSLVNQAKLRFDVVVMSIFVNPTQFGPNEDYEAYPRDLQRDAALAEEAGVSVIFAPAVKEMYPQFFSSYVNVTGVSEPLCGGARPGHFQGVATVVTKLINIIQPNAVFFGQKDFQQVLVIKRMVEDLNINSEIIAVPIVREADGLAMSSRNVYLSPEERQAGLVLFRSLKLAQELVANGEKDIRQLKQAVLNNILEEPLANVDYVEILSLPNLTTIEHLTGKVLLALAVRFGKTRLIDNAVLEA